MAAASQVWSVALSALLNGNSSLRQSAASLLGEDTTATVWNALQSAASLLGEDHAVRHATKKGMANPAGSWPQGSPGSGSWGGHRSNPAHHC